MTQIKFTGYMTRREHILTLAYIPVHLVILPIIFIYLATKGMDINLGELIRFGLGFAYMLIVLFPFLRRQFDPFCDRPMLCVSEVFGSYLAMLGCNFLLGLVLSLFVDIGANPNNEAVMEIADGNLRYVKAMSIFFAPIVEEMIFRGAIFAPLLRKSRKAAYIVSTLAFALLHVGGYAIFDLTYLIYLLQYIPISLLLARCYERTNSIWTSIFLHMLVNAMSINAMLELQKLL